MKNALTGLTLIIILLIVSSFSNSIIVKGDEGVPPDFGKTETTLIIMKLAKMKTANKNIEENFTKHYKGKFIMVDELNETYSDTEKFKYVMNTLAMWQPATGMGNTRMPASYTYTGSIVDRVTNKSYGVGYEGAAYGPFFKNYAKRLDAARLKNSSN